MSAETQVETVLPGHARRGTTEARPLARRSLLGPSPAPRHHRLRSVVTAPARPEWNGHDRRAADPVGRLSRELDSLCVAAVDAVEIAAGLEAAGFTDRTAREYGARDVFDLAETLFDRTRFGRGRPGRPKLVNAWAERPLRHMLRGVAFAAPGLLFVACLPAVTGDLDRAALVVAMLLAWPGSQAMAFFGHLLEGRRHPAGARAVLRLALFVLAVVAVGFGVLAAAVGVDDRVAALGAGEVLYLAAAAVVLVLGHERLALAVLAPGVLAAAVGLFAEHAVSGGASSGAGLVAAGGALVSVASAVVAALVVLGRPRRGDLRSGLAVIAPEDRVEARWHTAYGVTGGLLVTLPSVAGLDGDLVAGSLVPVIWSMGVAEWQVVRMRRRIFDLLNEAITLDFFRTQAVRLLHGSSRRYAAGLVALTVAVLAVAVPLTGAAPSAPVLAGLGFGLALGLAFFRALIVTSMGGIRIVVVVLAVSVALAAVALALLPTGPALLVAPVAAFVLLLQPCRDAVCDPTRHM